MPVFTADEPQKCPIVLCLKQECMILLRCWTNDSIMLEICAASPANCWWNHRLSTTETFALSCLLRGHAVGKEAIHVFQIILLAETMGIFKTMKTKDVSESKNMSSFVDFLALTGFSFRVISHMWNAKWQTRCFNERRKCFCWQVTPATQHHRHVVICRHSTAQGGHHGITNTQHKALHCKS